MENSILKQPAPELEPPAGDNFEGEEAAKYVKLFEGTNSRDWKSLYELFVREGLHEDSDFKDMIISFDHNKRAGLELGEYRKIFLRLAELLGFADEEVASFAKDLGRVMEMESNIRAFRELNSVQSDRRFHFRSTQDENAKAKTAVDQALALRAGAGPDAVIEINSFEEAEAVNLANYFTEDQLTFIREAYLDILAGN